MKNKILPTFIAGIVLMMCLLVFIITACTIENKITEEDVPHSTDILLSATETMPSTSEPAPTESLETQATPEAETISPVTPSSFPLVSFDPSLLPTFTKEPSLSTWCPPDDWFIGTLPPFFTDSDIMTPSATTDTENTFLPSTNASDSSASTIKPTQTAGATPVITYYPTFVITSKPTAVVTVTTRPTAGATSTPRPTTTAKPTATATATAKPIATATATAKPVATNIPEEDIIVAKKQNATFNTSADITVSGNNATVKTASGLQYNASSFVASSNGKFSINQNFKITFDSNTFTKNFNRFTLCYVSSQPLKGKITYTESGSTKTDEFFLEAGTNTFSCLITNYLNNKKGTKITSITISTCEGVLGDFLLCDFSCEDYTVFSNDVYYLENGTYKVGIRLLWGGGICYIRDKNSPVSGLTNLVNQADTGRLIQQSYYGTGGNSEYTPGYFNGSNWAYNPVQGGDQYGNHSRIIDIVVEDYSIYIKSQPQDWSLNGKITPSYMENSYTLYSNRIQVDNRFVDFSGWTHRYADQELPAFYTVSYLDKFTWYDGSKGWTGDTLTSRSDLNFWGDPAYHDDCVFPIRMSNKETWCSWTNSSVDYGIGLYVPNVDIFLAGKHAYNGSMSANNGACNYVAPLNVMLLVSYDALEYSYLITTGSVNEIRETFSDNKDFADNASLHKNYISSRVADGGDPLVLDFSVESNASILEATNNTKIKYEKPKGALKLQAVNASDVQTYIDFSDLGTYTAGDYTTITIEYMIPTKNKCDGYAFELFLCTGSTIYPEAGKSVKGNYTKDGQYHTVEISLKELSFWNGKINGIRFDYFDGCVTNDELFIKSITLS